MSKILVKRRTRLELIAGCLFVCDQAAEGVMPSDMAFRMKLSWNRFRFVTNLMVQEGLITKDEKGRCFITEKGRLFLGTFKELLNIINTTPDVYLKEQEVEASG